MRINNKEVNHAGLITKNLAAEQMSMVRSTRRAVAIDICSPPDIILKAGMYFFLFYYALELRDL